MKRHREAKAPCAFPCAFAGEAQNGALRIPRGKAWPVPGSARPAVRAGRPAPAGPLCPCRPAPSGRGRPHGTLEARRFLRRGPRGNSRAKAQAVPVRAEKGIHLCIGRFGAERHLTNRVKAILFALAQANPERPLEQHGEAGMRTSHLHPSFPKQAQRAPAGNGQPRRQVTDGMRRARTTNRAVFLSPCHDDSTRQSRCQSMAHAVPLCYTVGRAGLRHFFKRRGAGSAGRAAPFLS